MKKYIVVVMFLIFNLFTINSYAKSYNIKWENTEVEVLCNTSITKYIDIPKATLYVDNKKIDDAIIEIDSTGDWLYYLSDIDTHKIGRYSVWYKAIVTDLRYQCGICSGYKVLVNFNVVDKEAPKISVINKNIRIRRNTDYDLKKNIKAVDNVDTNLNIEITSDFNNKKIGNYKVSAICTDKSLNKSNMVEYNIEVYEDNYPTIKYLNEGSLIKLEINSKPSIKEYFSASDELDGDLTNMIVYPSVDTSRVGFYEYTVSVTNKAMLKTNYQFEVEIVDSSIPKLTLKNDKIIWDIKNNVSNINLRGYIDTLTDNDKVLSVSLVEISGQIESKIGDYEVVYSYNDGINEVRKTLIVSVVSTKGPTILCTPVSTTVGQKVDLYDYVEVYDESDELVSNTLEIDYDSVNFNQAGNYEALVYAINSSGIESTKRLSVVVNQTSDEKKEEIDYKKYLPYIALGLAIIFLLYNSSKKKAI